MQAKNTRIPLTLRGIEVNKMVGRFFVDRVPKVAVCYYVLSGVDEGGVVYWARGNDWESVLSEAYESLSHLEIIKKAA